AETKRQIALLEACWSAFDRTAAAALGAELRKGPRGGGRELDAIVQHVMGADVVYLAQIGDRSPFRDDEDVTPEQAAGLRSTIVEAVWARVRGEPPGSRAARAPFERRATSFASPPGTPSTTPGRSRTERPDRM